MKTFKYLLKLPLACHKPCGGGQFHVYKSAWFYPNDHPFPISGLWLWLNNISAIS